MAAFVAFFLAYFQPGNVLSEDLTDIPAQVVGYTLIALVANVVMILIVPAILTRTFEPERWTFGKYIGYNLLIVVVISLLNAWFNYYLLEEEFTLHQWVAFDLRNTFSISLLVLIPASYMIRTYMLKEYLYLAQEANRKLMAKQTALQEATEQKPKLHIESDTRERLEITEDKFLYAESEDNYTIVYWNNDKKLTNRMLRISLGRLEEQLQDLKVARCHRSFIVNLDRVTTVNGNSNGLTLVLDGGIAEVPVSRSNVAEVQNQLNARVET